MKRLTLAEKKAIFNKSKRANFAASLRLEGMMPSPAEGDIEPPRTPAALEAVKAIHGDDVKKACID